MSFEKIKSVFREKCIPYGNWWFYPLGFLWWCAMFFLLIFLPAGLSSSAVTYSQNTGVIVDLNSPAMDVAAELLNLAVNLWVAFIGFLLGSVVSDLLRRFWAPAAGKNAAKE